MIIASRQASYLGIEPTERGDYFFASYCNEDAERLTPLVKALAHNNVPLWYDYGLTYGGQWQTQLADRIQGCQAVLLFISKSLFSKPQSYVTTEYEMATEYFDKTVYAVHIDDISKADTPNAYLGWRINATQSQSLIVIQYPSEERLMDEFARMLKISHHRERVSTAMEQYRHLLAIGDSDRAQAILQSVLHEQMIETKARLVAKLFDGGYADAKAVKTDDAFKTLAQWKLCAIDDMSFRARAVLFFTGLAPVTLMSLTFSEMMSASSPSAGWLTPATAPFCTTRTMTCSSSCITPIQMCQTIRAKQTIAI